VLPVLSSSAADVGGRGRLSFFRNRAAVGFVASTGNACCASDGDEGGHVGPDFAKLRGAI